MVPSLFTGCYVLGLTVAATLPFRHRSQVLSLCLVVDIIVLATFSVAQTVDFCWTTWGLASCAQVTQALSLLVFLADTNHQTPSTGSRLAMAEGAGERGGGVGCGGTTGTGGAAGYMGIGL